MRKLAATFVTMVVMFFAFGIVAHVSELSNEPSVTENSETINLMDIFFEAMKDVVYFDSKDPESEITVMISFGGQEYRLYADEKHSDQVIDILQSIPDCGFTVLGSVCAIEPTGATAKTLPDANFRMWLNNNGRNFSPTVLNVK